MPVGEGEAVMREVSTRDAESAERSGAAKVSVPTAPIMDTVVSGEERRPHATAWFAPFPPGALVKEVEVRVSPGSGRRGVVVIRSVLSEPIMRIDIVCGEMWVRMWGRMHGGCGDCGVGLAYAWIIIQVGCLLRDIQIITSIQFGCNIQ